jgi:Tfp pilus assembly protein PilF
VRGALVAAVLFLNGSSGRAKSQGSAPVLPAEARDAYSRARFYLEKPTEANLRHAVVLFEHALDVEPLYAAAYAGLGDTYLRLGYGSYLAPSDAFLKALAAARHAIELDSLAPEAHATLAFARMYYDWDWPAAEKEFRLATRLAPGYALGHEWYAYLLCVLGRDMEARREIELAQRLAPLSVAIAVDAGFVSFYTGNLTDARHHLEGALLMAPEVPIAHLWLGRVAQGENNLDRARSEYEATGALKDWVPTIAGAAYVEALRGNRAAARYALVRLDSIARDRYVTPYAVALVYAALGEPDEAFHWLDRAVADRTHWLVWLNRDTRWTPLRDDPRFVALLQRVGVPH